MTMTKDNDQRDSILKVSKDYEIENEVDHYGLSVIAGDNKNVNFSYNKAHSKSFQPQGDMEMGPVVPSLVTPRLEDVVERENSSKDQDKMYIELDKVLQTVNEHNNKQRRMSFENPNMAKVAEAFKPRQPSERRSMIASPITITSPTS